MSENVETSVNPKETETINSQSGQDENVNINNEILTYESAKIALPTMIDEYTKERERAGIIDTKAISLITILLALVTVYMPITPFEKIKSIYETGTKNQLILSIVSVLIFFTALVLIGISFYRLINIVKLRTYKRVDVKKIMKDENIFNREDIYTIALCDHYVSLILQNSKSNDDKSNKLNSCYILTIFSFLLLLISYICIKCL